MKNLIEELHLEIPDYPGREHEQIVIFGPASTTLPLTPSAFIPNRRVSDEGAVPGTAPDSEEMDHAHPGLETGHDTIHDPVRRAARTMINRQLHRKIYNLVQGETPVKGSIRSQPNLLVNHTPLAQEMFAISPWVNGYIHPAPSNC